MDDVGSIGGVTHEYLTLNGKVVYEKIGTGNTAKIMVFTYDAQGRPFAVKYSKNNGDSFTNYFYALNLQGDVVKIFRPVSVKDADGNITGYTEKTYATYSYNAWGELTGITDSNGNSILNKQTTSTTLANLNPLRYRGYYYDNETGFYYLQSRYYDPANHRFINADSYASTDSTETICCNMFAYCRNSPIQYIDVRGYDAIILYDSSFPTHIGALFQDEDGTWWHFYWGAKDDTSARIICVFGCDVEPLTWCKQYDGKIDLESINNSGQFSGDYEEMIYLKGDYSASVDAAKNARGEYNLYDNNCMQKTMEVLSHSLTSDYETFLKIKNDYVLPAKAFTELKRRAFHGVSF